MGICIFMISGRALHLHQWRPLICTPHVFSEVGLCDRPRCLPSNSTNTPHQQETAIMAGCSPRRCFVTLMCSSSTLALPNKCLCPWNPSVSRSGRKGVSDPSIKFVYGAAVGQLHADIAAAVRPGEPARNGRPSIKPTVRQYKPLGGREHTRPSSARFIALIYTLHWWIPHKWPIRKAELKLHPQCHSSPSTACTSAKRSSYVIIS